MITQVDLYEVEIPPIAPIARYFPKIYDITLCRVQTDEGLVGWGEYQGTRAAHAVAAEELVGQDPLGLDPFAQPDAFTCALLDIAGRDVILIDDIFDTGNTLQEVTQLMKSLGPNSLKSAVLLLKSCNRYLTLL